MTRPLPPSRPARLRLLLSVLLFFSFSASVFGQTTVSGCVVDDENRAIPGANVLLRTDTDSTLVKGTATDSTGRFVIPSVQAGTYRLQAPFVGYDGPVSTSLVLTGEPNRDVGAIVLRPSEILLEDVVVAARRPLFEQRNDRLVVNVRQSATLAGADALEILQRSPGVVVNEQAGAVTLLGKSGVQVLVNGRPVQVPPEALVQYFTGRNANAIERVELITSPPARMDAEGDAGFINIVLRQSSEEGVRGSLSATGGYGEGEVGSANSRSNGTLGPSAWSREARRRSPSWAIMRRATRGSLTVYALIVLSALKRKWGRSCACNACRCASVRLASSWASRRRRRWASEDRSHAMYSPTISP